MLRGHACGPDWTVMMHGGFGRSRYRAGRAWWMGAFGDPPPRAERGEIRYLVLDAIKDQPRHGYEVIQHIEGRAGGSYRPSPGVIYPTLQMLEELGHAEAIDQSGRKAYRVTEAGRVDLDQNRAAVDDFYERADDDPWESYAAEFAEIMGRVAGLVKVFKRGARAGRLTPETLRAIRSALDEALRRIEDAVNGPRR